MKIVLVGFMGAGKSTVAGELAQKLGIERIETDELVLKASARKSIAEIFSQDGESRFRELERGVAESLRGVEDKIISPGGGLVMNPDNLRALADNGLIIYLKTNFATIVKRLAGDSTRPLFNDLDSAKELFDLREPIYRKTAVLAIETDAMIPAAVADQIVAAVRPAGGECTVIGNPIAQSLSPKLHTEAYRGLGIEQQFKFGSARVLPEELATFVQTFRKGGGRGLAVTIPHKETILKYLDYVEPNVETIGAANTVVNFGGTLCGFNTDWIGVVRPLLKQRELSGARVAILGAGGTARAALFGLQRFGAVATVINRTFERGERLARQFGCQARALKDLKSLTEFEIVINTTAAELAGGDPIIDPNLLEPRQLVMDALYKPFETNFLRSAKSRGCSIVHGAEMFLEQAIAQFKLQIGIAAPAQVMEQVLCQEFNVSSLNG